MSYDPLSHCRHNAGDSSVKVGPEIIVIHCLLCSDANYVCCKSCQLASNQVVCEFAQESVCLAEAKCRFLSRRGLYRPVIANTKYVVNSQVGLLHMVKIFKQATRRRNRTTEWGNPKYSARAHQCSFVCRTCAICGEDFLTKLLSVFAVWYWTLAFSCVLLNNKIILHTVWSIFSGISRFNETISGKRLNWDKPALAHMIASAFN